MKLKLYTQAVFVKVAATLSASIVLFFGVVIPMFFWAMLFESNEPMFGDEIKIGTTLLALLCAGIVFVALGRITALFVLYLFPPGLSGSRNSILIKSVFVLGAIWIVISCWAACRNFHILNFLFFFLLNLLWLAGVGYPVLNAHFHPSSFLHKPFNLFLRRFSSFADQIVNEALLKLSNFNAPVAFLTVTKVKAGNWSPSKFVRGIINMPLVRRCKNEQWKSVAFELIERAEIIIIDLSEDSESMNEEIEMINLSNRWKDTVLLIRSKNEKTYASDQIQKFKKKGAEIILYKTEWNEALDRVGCGCLVVFGIATIVFIVLSIAVIALISVFKNVPYEAVGKNATESPLFVAGSIAFAILALSNSVSFFFKPGLDKSSTELLRAAIRKQKS